MIPAISEASGLVYGAGQRNGQWGLEGLDFDANGTLWGVDTGTNEVWTINLATAAGTPVIGLYATSNPARTGPYLSQQLCVNRYPDAVRRYLGKHTGDLRWGQRVRHPDAMELITVSDVTAKIDEFFSI